MTDQDPEAPESEEPQEEAAEAYTATVEGEYQSAGREHKTYKLELEVPGDRKDDALSYILKTGGPLESALKEQDIHFRAVVTHHLVSLEPL